MSQTMYTYTLHERAIKAIEVLIGSKVNEIQDGLFVIAGQNNLVELTKYKFDSKEIYLVTHYKLKDEADALCDPSYVNTDNLYALFDHHQTHEFTTSVDLADASLNASFSIASNHHAAMQKFTSLLTELNTIR